MLASSIARRELLRSTAVAGRVAHRVPARLVHFKPPNDLDFKNLEEAKKNRKPGDFYPPDRPPTPLAVYLQQHPRAKQYFLKLQSILGFQRSKPMAGRRGLMLYERVCAVKPDDEAKFWKEDCYLPSTFQSWFTIVNLHVWMLTVRLRAIPPPYGRDFVQALLDTFFYDLEDRITGVLQPKYNPPTPYTFHSDFYHNPNKPPEGAPRTRLGRAPDRLITRQLKTHRDQYMGFTLSMDAALVQGDMEMAASVWRNLLGARGAAGVVLPAPGQQPQKYYRRSINPPISEPHKIDVEREQWVDDHSGVHDFPPAEADKYLTYPELMLDLVTYIRREIKRLEDIPDEAFLWQDPDTLRFGKVRNYSAQASAQPKKSTTS
ncbi:uncharacterized protein SCHCODRAFT_02546960 [Schizophyllum commune H4-8]|uniref:Ubiquinol-cytochrome c chaperone domain-containing protein n=1 Tax=Schizophyllum commune (strain H4-8 / FGSC 9210) TaxID=578458 RepID=D8Q9K5_SCHCM|nr:uncharacterized protein SCHCODRAFT_02546960 [Schizophyllum commune H4-8]KAI5890379.1 hypothetical protein SCHCODRAFT_02546960 [Schizophyllum commune H4-8]